MAHLFPPSALAKRAEEIDTADILDRVAILQSWLDDYDHGSLRTDSEEAREGGYTEDVFCKVLGHKLKPSPSSTFESKVGQEGKFPDAIIRSNGSADLAAVVEYKRASVDLDKPQKGPNYGNLSPVQQAFNYKNAHRVCPFVIVTNFFEFRLYNNNRLDYERWTLRDLLDPADDYLEFKKWYVLVCADNLVVEKGKSPTELFLSDVRHDQIEIGKGFYEEYRQIRLDLLRDLWLTNPAWQSRPDETVQKAQKIIDRFVFICFAEDCDLMRADTLGRWIKDADQMQGTSLWEEFQALSRRVANGSGYLEIPAGYGGDLFAEDAELNSLHVSDGPLRALAALGSRYNFSDDLTVTVLGHVFEQSITDLEQIKRGIQAEPGEFDPESDLDKYSRRKRDGIFYTPDYVVRYIVNTALGGYLSEREEQVKKKHNLSGMRTDAGYDAREKTAYTEYQHILQNIKVLDPACGSGAFLVHVFDYLLAENQRVDAILGGGLYSTDDYVRSILSDNIFGVDLNEESIEITKLSLWLKTASKGKKLATLDDNVKCGNSLLSDPEFTDQPFDWNTEFAGVMAKGGFDVVVGNPPYVSAIDMNKFLPEPQRKEMKKRYETAKGAVDLYIYFFERGIDLLRDGGRLGYITPNRYVSVSYGAARRQWLVAQNTVESILNCSDTRVFEDAATYPVITILKKDKPAHNYQVKAGKLEEQQPAGEWVTHGSEKLSSLPEYIIGFLLNDKLPISEKIFAQGESLTKVGAINATSTAGEAEEYGHHLSETTGHKIVNTGTIDPYLPLWGKASFTKQGKQYQNPRLDLGEVSANRRALYESPKIILSKLGLRAEAFYDSEGEYASIDTNCIHSFTDGYDPEYVLCWLNSRLYNFVFECLFDGARMSGGYMGYSAPSLRCTAIKRIDRADQQQFIDIAQELATLYSKKNDADRKFRTIIAIATGLSSWPNANVQWWVLDTQDFIKNFRKRFKASVVEDLMDAHIKHSEIVKKLADRIELLSHRADLRFYTMFGLTRTEIAKVEAMEFAI